MNYNIRARNCQSEVRFSETITPDSLPKLRERGIVSGILSIAYEGKYCVHGPNSARLEQWLIA